MTADRADFGSRLRAAREARGISLKDIAATTKISTLVLEALERNDPSRLPGGLFSRAFVRAYAREVGLDPEQTVREFAERFGESPEAARVDEPVRVRPVRIEQAPGNHSGVRWLGLVVTVLLVVVWIGVDRYFSRRAEGPPAPARTARAEAPPVPAAPPLPRLETPKVPPPVDPNATAGSGSQPAAEQTPSTQTQAVQPGAPTAPPPVPPPAPSETPPAAEPTPATTVLPLRIVLTATEACWISAKVDDQRIAARTLQPGEKLELSAARTIVLTTGDAAAVSYTINDSPGRSLGAAGEVKTAIITTANYRTFLTGRQ